MSFQNNCKTDKIPGAIKGNPLSGLCERASIMVDKVFDSCIKQETLVDYNLTLTSFTPSTATAPFTFISGKSIVSAAKVKNLSVSEISGEGCCARVVCQIEIPVEVAFVDSKGVQCVGVGVISIPKDVVLNISAPSVMPYNIVATCNAVLPSGTYSQGCTFSVNVCLTEIISVTMQVQLLVPSYGYTFIPPCQEFTSEICDGVFDLPLYPEECGVEPRCCPTHNNNGCC